eukprot:scaffold2469_cov239-Pinguiococcus_pyrenoidosus.AAC.8
MRCKRRSPLATVLIRSASSASVISSAPATSKMSVASVSATGIRASVEGCGYAKAVMRWSSTAELPRRRSGSSAAALRRGSVVPVHLVAAPDLVGAKLSKGVDVLEVLRNRDRHARRRLGLLFQLHLHDS